MSEQSTNSTTNSSKNSTSEQVSASNQTSNKTAIKNKTETAPAPEQKVKNTTHTVNNMEFSIKLVKPNKETQQLAQVSSKDLSKEAEKDKVATTASAKSNSTDQQQKKEVK